MSNKTSVKGTAQILKTLRKIEAGTSKATPHDIEEAAMKIEREAAITVRVAEGRLKGSIQTIKVDDTHFEVSAGGVVVDGVEVSYAGVIEFGGPGRQAYPYMRPAADKVQAEYPDIIISGIAQAIKRAIP